MKELKCPKCGTAITVSDTDYADILNQVRTKAFETEVKRRVAEMQAAKEAEIVQLKSQAELDKAQAELKEKSIREDYENKLRVANEEVAYYKDLKVRLSTKMVGETLEAHCSTIFETEMRSFLPNALFEKDNDASHGSKGDFIFRDYNEGTEYISIMFEMKNEMDTTATKHKNEDFFKKLDADRTAKGCEYAVLVSMLEPESELYNSGIVDMSHRYPKMYVVRPQFFRPIISLLTNAAKKTLDIKKELELVRSQSIEITDFNDQLEAFKKGFARNWRLASEKHQSAVDGIDKAIEMLQKIRDGFISSENNLRLAGEKLEDLTIKRLTRNLPEVRAKFESAGLLK